MKERVRETLERQNISFIMLAGRGEKLIYAKPFGWLPDALATVLAFVCYLGGLGVLGFRFGFGLVFPCSTQSNFIYFCFVFFYFIFPLFFFGSHCCMWHMANRCRTSSFESQQRKKEDTLNQVPRKGYMYCVARQECVVRFDVQVVCYM